MLLDRLLSLLRDRRILIAVAALMAVGAILGFLERGPRTVFGDYEIPAGSTMLNDGGAIAVSGDITIDGTLSCDGMPLRLVAGGTITVRGTLSCFFSSGPDRTIPGPGVGIALAAPRVFFAPTATLRTNGSVDIATEERRLLMSDEETNEVFESIAVEDSTGARLGPFGSGRKIAKARAVESRARTAPSVTKANANLVLSGEWTIGANNPAAKGRSILRIDGGPGGYILLSGLRIEGGDGKNGGHSQNVACTAIGERGGDAFRMLVNAGNVEIGQSRFALGSGGAGGNAETPENCSSALAEGGVGGDAGNLKIAAANRLTISDLTLAPGSSGDGGFARAYGKNGGDACPGEDGGDAIAIAGAGGDNDRTLFAEGPVEGVARIITERVDAGSGGRAFARGGRGGAGLGCGCSGGKGGNAIARGGGGSANIVIPGVTGEADAGSGGDADAAAGNGEKGGSCTNDIPGGSGGKGGNASAEPGRGGNGHSANGEDGKLIGARGGKGGAGGDGCPPGTPGAGGIGAPNGIGGKEAARTPTCPVPPKPIVIEPQKPKTVAVIEYLGKYIPLSELGSGDERGCGAPSYHPLDKVAARALDGTLVPVPALLCGYGKVRERPVIDLPAQ